MNTDPAPERHSRKCAICTHPDREAIDEAFLHWSRRVWADDSAQQNIVQIVKNYDVPSLSSLYRHAHATGLWLRRRTKIRFALDRIIEKAGETKPNAYAVIRAIQISCRFADDGTYTEPTKQVLIEHRHVISDSNPNRNAFRLETVPTPKRQAANPNSNREPQRLETPVTPTKQRPSTSSNRENKAPSQAPNPQSQADTQSKSNREALRLETPVNPTKQTPDPDPNRENKALFSEGARTMVNAEIQKMLIGKQRINLSVAKPRKIP
jgi:hypothetical protein